MFCKKLKNFSFLQKPLQKFVQKFSLFCIFLLAFFAKTKINFRENVNIAFLDCEKILPRLNYKSRVLKFLPDASEFGFRSSLYSIYKYKNLKI
jgi:hypothetical protein